MVVMTQSTPSMSRSRIDIRSILNAHSEASASDMMAYMLNFERVLEGSVRSIIEAIRSRADAQQLLPALNDAMQQAFVMGAVDLQDATKNVVTAIQSGDRNKALAQALAWTSIAEESRTANMMFFQSCLLFGYAPNGKSLPDLEEAQS
jgi:hypothetical protein